MERVNPVANTRTQQLQRHLQATKGLLENCFQGHQHRTIRKAARALIEKLQIGAPLGEEACAALSRDLTRINLRISQHKRAQESLGTYLDETHAAFCRDAVIESIGLPPPN